MEKKYIEKNQNYTIYEDYSVDVLCQNCGKIDRLQSDSKQARLINQIPNYGNEYLCYSCWVEEENKKIILKEKQKREEIIKGQAFNKAVDVAINCGLNDDKEFERNVIKYFKMFYKILSQIQNGQKENNN